MADINMDPQNKPDAKVPVFEFKVPKSEIDADLKVGDLGKLLIPVEVVADSDDSYTFRKKKLITVEGTFRPETVNEMRDRLIEKQKDDEE